MLEGFDVISIACARIAAMLSPNAHTVLVTVNYL
jgi:hypothetical protein